MKLQLVLVGVLALTTLFVHGGPVVIDASKNAKAIAPIQEAAWGGPIVGGGVKANSEYVDGNVFLVAPLLNTIGGDSTMEGNVLFVEPYATWGSSGEAGGSLGIGFRHLFSEQSVSDARSSTVAGLFTEGFYVGGNVFLDYAHSQLDNDFWQIGVGLEAGTRYLSLRANYYIPVSDEKVVVRRAITNVSHSSHTSTNTVASAATVSGGNIVQTFNKTTTTRSTTSTTRQSIERFEEPLEGWDVELALLVPGLDQWCDVSLIGGYYSYGADRSRDIKGWRAGVEVRPVPAVVLFANWYEDSQLYQDEWIAGVRLEIPLGKGWKDAFTPRRRHLAERLYEPVHRKNTSITTNTGEQQNSTTSTSTSTSTSQSNKQIIQQVPSSSPIIIFE
jgi:hypothetical protein